MTYLVSYKSKINNKLIIWYKQLILTIFKILINLVLELIVTQITLNIRIVVAIIIKFLEIRLINQNLLVGLRNKKIKLIIMIH